MLFGVSLTVAAGEMVSLLGRNGMGKTTTVPSSGRTKSNRARPGIAKIRLTRTEVVAASKSPDVDAACVGNVGTLVGCQIPTLAIKATGRGSCCRTKLTAHGFPRGHCMRAKSIHGFKTGAMVRADASKGKKAETYIGRVAVRASGSFNVQTPTGVVQGINARAARSSIVPTGTNITNKGRRFLCWLLPAVFAPISDDFG